MSVSKGETELKKLMLFASLIVLTAMSASVVSASMSAGYMAGSVTTNEATVLAKVRVDCFIPQKPQPFAGILVDPQAVVIPDQTDLLIHVDYLNSKPGKESTLWYSSSRTFNKRTAKRAEVVSQDYTFRSRNFWQSLSPTLFGRGHDKTVQIPVEDFVRIKLDKSLGTQGLYFFLEIEGGSAKTYRVLFVGVTFTHDQVAPSDCLQFVVKRCAIPLKKRTIGNMGLWMELYGTKGSATDPEAAEKTRANRDQTEQRSGQVFVSREQLEQTLAQLNTTDQALTDKVNGHEDRIAYVEGYLANMSQGSGANTTAVSLPMNFKGNFGVLRMTVRDSTGCTVFDGSVNKTGTVLQLPYGSYDISFESGGRTSRTSLVVDEKLMSDLPVNFNL